MSTALTVSTKNPCLLPSMVACAILAGSAACAVATIVLITAVPTAPANCSSVFMAALPSALSSYGNWLRPLVIIVPMEKPCPKAKNR